MFSLDFQHFLCQSRDGKNVGIHLLLDLNIPAACSTCKLCMLHNLFQSNKSIPVKWHTRSKLWCAFFRNPLKLLYNFPWSAKEEEAAAFLPASQRWRQTWDWALLFISFQTSIHWRDNLALALGRNSLFQRLFDSKNWLENKFHSTFLIILLSILL